MLNGKNSRKGDLKTIERLKINEERGLKEEERAQSKKSNWDNNRKQEETQFFSQKMEVRWYETKQITSILLHLGTES